jgi:hypothetical protein
MARNEAKAEDEDEVDEDIITTDQHLIHILCHHSYSYTVVLLLIH